MKIIPAIDLRGGACVRLLRGDFGRQTRYNADPLVLAQRYADAGMDELHVVDLDGAQSGQGRNRDIIHALVQDSGLDVQLGGGIRAQADVEAWLDAGVTRCVVGTLAISDAPTVRDWLRRYGGERIVLALDVNIGDDGVPFVATHGWTRATDVSLWNCINAFEAAGLQHVLCTDISRDGAMEGPATGLYRTIVERHARLSLQASGGVRHIDDLHELRNAGASAAICGRSLLDGTITPAEIRQFLRAA